MGEKKFKDDVFMDRKSFERQKNQQEETHKEDEKVLVHREKEGEEDCQMRKCSMRERKEEREKWKEDRKRRNLTTVSEIEGFLSG